MDQTHDILDTCTAKAEAVFSSDANAASARDAALYLAHTGMGESIRKLAEAAGTHPSTVLRAVRRVEQSRDDPIFDRLLTEAEDAPLADPEKDAANQVVKPMVNTSYEPPSAEALRRDAKRYLRRLSEPGAFLLIAHGAERAGIFCSANEHKRPIALLAVGVAAEFLKQDWIKASSRGTATVRYRITDVGRSFLRRALAEEAQDRGQTDGPQPFASQHQERGERLFIDKASGTATAQAVNLGESPIGWLARRKGSDGKPFLSPEEVDASEKLRADFEIAQIGPQIAQDWRRFLTPSDRYSGSPRGGNASDGAMAARDRVMAALAALGPGLSDVALRTCCFLEGLEACERRMGWSARSGKVVLKLALQRLAEHYGMIVFKD
ncbi:MAG: DUF6456 domain-containing protein [Pseudomonadota bacterium]